MKGFEPLAVTDCLNFGNPEKPEIMSEFVASVEGISEACEALDTPVISGNVSFYNETLGQNITSTPAIGLVGLKDSITGIPHSRFQKQGEPIYLWRKSQAVQTGQMGEDKSGHATWSGRLDAKSMAAWIKFVRETVNAVPVTATRASGKYGLAYTLARMCTDELGFQLRPGSYAGKSSDWFLEHFYEVILVCPPSQKAQLESRMKEDGEYWLIGEVVPGLADFNEGKPILLTDLAFGYSSCWRVHFESLA